MDGSACGLHVERTDAEHALTSRDPLVKMRHPPPPPLCNELSAHKSPIQSAGQSGDAAKLGNFTRSGSISVPGSGHDGRTGWTGQTGQHISVVSW